MTMTIQSKLENLKEEKYREFSLKLLPKDTNILGVRLPVLRKLSKKVRLEELTDNTFEEIMLQGMVIARIKDFEVMKEKLISFLPKINNWSICDSFVSSLSITLKHPSETLELLKNLSTSSLEFTKRFVIVMLLRYYINEKYLEEAIKLVLSISKDEYYVKMACSWFITEVYAFDKTIGENLLEKQENRDIIKMTKSKIRDSFKIKKDKESRF